MWGFPRPSAQAVPNLYRGSIHIHPILISESIMIVKSPLLAVTALVAYTMTAVVAAPHSKAGELEVWADPCCRLFGSTSTEYDASCRPLPAGMPTAASAHDPSSPGQMENSPSPPFISLADTKAPQRPQILHSILHGPNP